jgi:hypothetical protein
MKADCITFANRLNKTRSSFLYFKIISTNGIEIAHFVKMITFGHHFIKNYCINHFVKSQKMIKKQIVCHCVITTYGVFYLVKKPKALSGVGWGGVGWGGGRGARAADVLVDEIMD